MPRSMTKIGVLLARLSTCHFMSSHTHSYLGKFSSKLVFIDRLHFTKAPVASISDNFYLNPGFKFVLAVALRHRFFPHNLFFPSIKWLRDRLC